MKTISKILILWVCILCFTNPAKAEYKQQACGADNSCPSGWTQVSAGTTCVCFMCDGGEDCEAKKGAMKGCEPLPVKLAEANKCIFCPLFEALYSAARTMATEAFNATKDPIRNVMLYGFAIYVAFGVLKLVSSMTKQDAPKYISGLLVDTCKFMVAFFLLQSADSIYYFVINPLLSTSLDFGGAMLFSAGDAISTCKADAKSLGVFTEILPDSLYTSLECFIKGVQSEIAFAQAAGSSIMCISINEGAGTFGIPDFSMLLSGLTVYVCALLLSLAFGFYLIDSIVMLGVLGALMTFFIACWPFKLTGGYTGKGFGMFMNVFFNFVFMGIVVSVNTQLIKASLATGGLENLEAVLCDGSGNIKDTKEILDITGAGFLVILCCCFFGFKFTAKSASLASSMAGGGGIDIGSKLGTLLTSGAVNSAVRVGKSAVMPTVNKVWDGAKDAGNKVLEVTGDAIFHPMKSARKFQGVLNKRYGQAQQAAGAVQGIVGNLKGNADMVKRGEELYNKGKANKAAGQSRIDRENQALYPERQEQDKDYNNFDGNSSNENDVDNSSANNWVNERIKQLEDEKKQLVQALEQSIADGNISAEQKAELERKIQDKQQEIENMKSDTEQKVQAAQQQAAYGQGGNEQNQPAPLAERQAAQQDYMKKVEEYMKNSQSLDDMYKQHQQKFSEIQMLEDRLKNTTQGSPEYENIKSRIDAVSAEMQTLAGQRQAQTQVCNGLREQTTAARIRYNQATGYDKNSGLTAEQIEKIVAAKLRSQKNS